VSFRFLGIALCALLCCISVTSPSAQSLAPPPRNVADITAILNQEKPDEARLTKLRADAEAKPPAGVSASALGSFYFKRAQARNSLGRIRDSIADIELALKSNPNDDYKTVVSRYEQFLILRLRDTGDFKRRKVLIEKQLAAFSNSSKGRRFSLQTGLAQDYIRMGDLYRAELYIQRNRSLLQEAKRWDDYEIYSASYIASIEEGAGRLAEARGRYAEAEKSYRRASLAHADAMRSSKQWDSAPPQAAFERGVDWNLAFQGRVKAKQGRMTDGENDVRQALLSQLNKNGKFHADTAGILTVLAFVIQEQGRYQEAEQLQRQAISVFQTLDFAPDGIDAVQAQLTLAEILNLERRFEDAAEIYDRVDRLTETWSPAQREVVDGGVSRLILSLNRGDRGDLVEVARRLLDREEKRSGYGSFNTAMARGFLAVAMSRSGKAEEADALFKQAIPTLLASAVEQDDEGGSIAAAREGRIKSIVEAYLQFRTGGSDGPTDHAGDETFGYADLLRGQAVQRALQASAARASVSDRDLERLIRTEQDQSKQLGASVAILNNLLSQSSAERDAKALQLVQTEIGKLRTAQAQLRSDISRRFPKYESLIRPSSATSSDLRGVLHEEELLISYYFGRFESFAWAVRKTGPSRLVSLGLTAEQANAMVTSLRTSLEAPAALISDIPPFDLKLAFELYRKILQPFAEELKTSKSVIVATNGALGFLPLSMLPTAEPQLAANTADDPLFAEYQRVPWLARTHAVSYVPSVSTLVLLRRLPPTKNDRQPLVAFGDPQFSADVDTKVASADVAGAVLANTTRGMALKRRNVPQVEGAASVRLAQLPRLPDTADELRSIANALQVDAQKFLYLGRDANERTVKTLDLFPYRVLAFATHGLVPGELDGLTQPALALSSPAVTGGEGDGLLTMDEILRLKLNADWVVLSACNTGAGAEAGAEAASGLGRAFFYAGSRALLVTNWSVHSQSAKELITDTFRRQAANVGLARSEATRQAMVALMDGDGYRGDDGRIEFTYAHPLFWAPYSIIGDGGKN
jgi:CHAT domain-containing protein